LNVRHLPPPETPADISPQFIKRCFRKETEGRATAEELLEMEFITVVSESAEARILVKKYKQEKTVTTSDLPEQRMATEDPSHSVERTFDFPHGQQMKKQIS
jgi:hypothetical protein